MAAVFSSDLVRAAAVVVLLALGTFKFILYPVLFSPLSRIPNAHFTSAISPLWILWKRFRMKGNRTIHEAHLKHGPIVRLGPSEISINCVDGGIRTVYAGGYEKHDWYKMFGSYGTYSMFSMLGSKPHSVRKRMLSNIYSKSFLQSSSQLKEVSKTVLYDRCLPIIQEQAEKGSSIEVHELNNAITMDFVAGYLFGLSTATNFLQDVEMRKKWLYAYQCRKPFEFYHQETPILLSLAGTLKIPLIPRWCTPANEYLEAWCLEICDKAEKHVSSTDPTTEPVVYKQLRKAMEKQLRFQHDDQLDEKTLGQLRLELAAETFDQLTAGHETSAVALTYLLWQMSKNPEIQVLLREELATLNPPITFPLPTKAAPELPPPKDIDALPLLDAIVTETLRLHAPIPGLQPRITPEGASLAGYDKLPANIRVNAQAYSLHQNPEVFPRPESWLPRRWLTKDDPTRLENMRRWFWAFGSGGRMCIGSNLALQAELVGEIYDCEMKLVVAGIYSNYTTAVIDDTGIEAIDAYTSPLPPTPGISMNLLVHEQNEASTNPFQRFKFGVKILNSTSHFIVTHLNLSSK
ncbi:hypothetical protein FQN57_000523 [Myotisia sp. PD_48]|nr:hypothetical protein FQN57_000523 [Myotisia sp. PD_48]